MEPVVERGREERRIAARRPGTEQRGPAGARSGLGVRDGGGERLPGAFGGGSLARNQSHGIERQALGDPRDLPVPGEGEAAEQRRRQVVGVGLQRDPGRQELLGRGVGCSGDEAEHDRCRRRAEASLEGDPVDEAESLSGRVGHERVGADREVRGIGRKLRGSFALDDDALAGGHLELVPEVERDRRGVEARADVGRGGWGLDEAHLRAAAAIASGSASTRTGGGAWASALAGSLRP